MSEAPTRDIIIEQGEDWSESFQILDENGGPISLTNKTFRGQAKKSYDLREPIVFTFTMSKFTDADGDHVNVSVPKATTLAMRVGKTKNDVLSTFYYTYEMVDSQSTLVDRILQGKCSISPTTILP